MRTITSVLFASCLIAACSAGSGSRGKGDGDGNNKGGGINVGDGDGDGGLPKIDGKLTTDAPGITAEGDPQVTVSGALTSVTFSLTDPDGAPLEGADWTTDDTRIGSVSSQGVFTANGFTGGVVKITATLNGAALTAQLVVDVDITENHGNVDSAGQASLLAGGSSDAAFKTLYPYSGTVFPRGVASPLLQYGGEAAQNTYLEITAEHYVYRQFGGASTRVRASLSAEVWKGLSLTVRPGAAATVRMTKKGASGVSGAAESLWHFASASLKGIIYYSTYNYPDPVDENVGAIVRVVPGRDAEVVQRGCTACHTVSANGKVLASGTDNNADENGEWNPVTSSSYDVTEQGTIQQRNQSTEGRLYSFLGLSPDGSVGLSNGIPGGLIEPNITHGIASSAGFPSRLVDTTSGAEITSPTLEALVEFAQYPSFAPDGSKVAFSNGDELKSNSQHKVLSVMDVDLSANPPVFSNLRNVEENTSNRVLAWPSFLPDGNGLIFHEGDSFDSNDFVADANAQSGERHAEIRLKDLQGGEVSELNALNGRLPDGSVYLPYGEAEEGEMNYEPSVLPVAVGGYYWVMFTSRRTYGNLIAPGGEIEAANGHDPWGTAAEPSARKKIWVAAIDVNYADLDDPSHPAFYLAGQDEESGNMRGFAAMTPCRPDGESCESGSDCCGGFCRETSRSADGRPELTCVPPPDACSNIDEPCETPADCCDTSLLCVNNRCTEPAPPILR